MERFRAEVYNDERWFLFAALVLVVLGSATAVILLVCLNPFGFPVRRGLLGSNSAHFPHGGEVHSISSMLGFSSRHVVGYTNVDKSVPVIALILVRVSCFGHITNIARDQTSLSVPIQLRPTI